jgi:hypothetical protein
VRVKLILNLLAAAAVALVGYEVLGPRVVLYRYGHADPIADADRAVKRGDLRLVGVQGRGIDVPGADSILGPVAVLRCATRPVPFTSDAITSDVIRRLNGVASSYARSYNVHLLNRAGGRCAARVPA